MSPGVLIALAVEAAAVTFALVGAALLRQGEHLGGLALVGAVFFHVGAVSIYVMAL